ncbi:ERAP1-like C-terminal domain-containing protein [Candidatus Saccharibacteria bacterium]|nr:ERAP1-like C-terminal domain-containing protein [Candidatus Saccharibacteria bacterium]
MWPIPLLSDKNLSVDIFDKRSLKLDLGKEKDVILNKNGSGHFVVNYTDKETKNNIKQKIIKREIDSDGRINALNDMLLLNQKGEYSLADIIDIVDECDQEPREAVWSMFSRAIGFASLLTEGDKTTESQIKKLKSKLSQYWFSELGWNDKEDDDPNTKLLRRVALALSIGGENKQALADALGKFDKAESIEELPAEQRSLIAGAAIRFSERKQEIAEKLMEEYEKSTNPDVQHSIASALCSTKDAKIAEKIISWGLNKNGAVRAQDLTRWYVGLIRNRHVRDLAWQWLVSVWDERYEELGGPKTLPYFIRYSASSITTEDRATEFKKFFDSKSNDTGLARDIKVAYSTIESQINWRKREEPKLKKYLQKYS